jgi:DNA-binding Lrp family transcriptional regulator
MRQSRNPYTNFVLNLGDWQKPFRFADPRMNFEEDEPAFDFNHPFANIATDYRFPNQIPNIFGRTLKQSFPPPNPYEEEDIFAHQVPDFVPIGQDGEPKLDRSKSKAKRSAGRLGMEAALAMQPPARPRDPNLKELGLALLPMLFGAGTRYFGPMAQAFMQGRDNEEQRRYGEYQQQIQKQMSKAQMDYDEEGRLRQDEEEDYANQHNKYESDFQRKNSEAANQYNFDKIGYFQERNPEEHEKLKSIFDKSQAMWKERIAKIEEDGIVSQEEIYNAIQAQQKLVGMFGAKYAGNFRIPEMGPTEGQRKKDKDWETENRTSIQNQFKDLLETIPRGNGITNLHTGMVSNWLAEKGIDPRAFPPLVVGESWESWLARNGLTLRSQKERFARIPSRKEVEQKLYDINANRIKDRVSRLGPVGRNTAAIVPQPDTSMLRKFRKLYIGNKPGTKTDETIERFIRYRENAISRNAWSESSENGFKQFIREVAGIDLDEDPKGII